MKHRRFIWQDESQVDIERPAVERGGPGSGHHGHEGRPGEVGGSAPGGGEETELGKAETYMRETFETVSPSAKVGWPSPHYLLTDGTIVLVGDHFSSAEKALKAAGSRKRSPVALMNLGIIRLNISGHLPVGHLAVEATALPNRRQNDAIEDWLAANPEASVFFDIGGVSGERADLRNVGITERGGPGSGHFGHGGRPGEVGGSAPGEGGPQKIEAPDWARQTKVRSFTLEDSPLLDVQDWPTKVGPARVYRASKEEYARRVTEEGIPRGRPFIDRPPSVYFFSDPSDALRFAVSYKANMPPGGQNYERGNVAVIEFEIPDSLDQFVVSDADANGDFGIRTAYRIEEDIPADAIRAVHYFTAWSPFPDPARGEADYNIEHIESLVYRAAPLRRGYAIAILLPPDESVERGGPGSGHRGHEGRPGERGGSMPSVGEGEGGPPTDVTWSKGRPVPRFGQVGGWGAGDPEKDEGNAEEWGETNARGSDIPDYENDNDIHRALSDYTTTAARQVNEYLRHGLPVSTEEAMDIYGHEDEGSLPPIMGESRLNEIADNLDRLMAPTQEPVVTWRMVGPGFGSSLREGERFSDKGFVSTSLMEAYAGSSVGVPTTWKAAIQVPAGTPAFYIGRASEVRGEYELLLGRGQSFEVVAVDRPQKEAILRVVR